MFKKSLLLVAISTAIWGFNAEVKKSDVSLEINGNIKSFKAGDKFSLKSGDIVCFKEGKGRVVIVGDGGYKKQLNRHVKSCKIMPGVNKNSGSGVNLSNLVSVVTQKAQEQSVSGVSRKGGKITKITKPIIVDKNKKYIAITSNEWAVPATIKLIDKDGKIVMQDKSDEDANSVEFIIPTKICKKASRVIVLDGFDTKVVDAPLKFK